MYRARMNLTRGRRTTLAMASIASVAAVAAFAGTAHGTTRATAPRHAAPRAHPAVSKVVQAELRGTAAAPHSNTTYAYGYQTTASFTSSLYALKSTGGAWKRLTVGGPANKNINGISAGSPTSAWLVGSSFGTKNAALVEHSTGGAFKPFSTSGLSAQTLIATAASAKDNVWVAGTATDGSALVAHLTGSTWKPETLPTPDSGSPFLTSISTTSPSNVWVLGQGSDSKPVVYHWDGSSFTDATPTVPAGTTLTSLSTAAASDTWAVGLNVSGSSVHTVAQHWNGTKWAPVSLPTPYTGTVINSVAIAKTGGFMVGEGNTKTATKAVVLRLHKQKWHNMRVKIKGKYQQLRQVTLTKKRAVAVGSKSRGQICTGKKSSRQHPLVLRISRKKIKVGSAPKFRRASGSRFAVPDRPAC
jgi:hypothetical protein